MIKIQSATIFLIFAGFFQSFMCWKNRYNYNSVQFYSKALTVVLICLTVNICGYFFDVRQYLSLVIHSNTLMLLIILPIAIHFLLRGIFK